ncbi:MAG TPA: glycosyltransferase family protein [Chitinophagales bacterium]|nr:glycosyltransferase family protein [Chitinophagales bacterium]
MNIIAITQARIGSTRLPAKILKEINGKSLLDYHLQRIKKSKLISNTIVATTDEEESDIIVEIANRNQALSYKGSLNNVLERFYKAAESQNPDYIVRLTSDCPLIDAKVIDEALEIIINNDYDYVATGLIPSYPDGISIEVFSFSALQKAYFEAELQSEREHVTPYIWKNSTTKGGSLFKSFNLKNTIDYSRYRLTVDTIEDFQLIELLINEVGADNDWMDYINYLEKNSSAFEINNKYLRNEGYTQSLNNEKNINHG